MESEGVPIMPAGFRDVCRCPRELERIPTDLYAIEHMNMSAFLFYFEDRALPSRFDLFFSR